MKTHDITQKKKFQKMKRNEEFVCTMHSLKYNFDNVYKYRQHMYLVHRDDSDD